MASQLIAPPRLRLPNRESERQATWLELFHDLVFAVVVSITGLVLKMVVVGRLPNWRIFIRLGFLAAIILLFGFEGAIFSPLLALFLCILLLYSGREGLLIVREARRRERVREEESSRQRGAFP